MKKIFIATNILLGLWGNSQVIVGPTASTATPKSYAGLEVRSDENLKQGIGIPVVALTDISSKTTPVVNPVDGMMVYNINSIMTQGLYVWSQKSNEGNGKWVQMADTSNIISAMLMKTTGSYDVLENSAIGNFVSLNDFSKYQVVHNDIGATFSTEGITLQKNSGYLITLALDLQADPTYLVAGKGMNDTDLYLHKYIIKLADSKGKVYGVPISVYGQSVAGKSENSHSVYATFSFPIVLDSVTLFPYISHQDEGDGTNDGNYYLGVPTGNTGKITVKSARLYIQRGILSL
ncbi:MAG: hypothetical protein Q4C75_03545 [Bergeyella zoohelcum]|nr:hypothetical protein [Bergeyella zoohelcum]